MTSLVSQEEVARFLQDQPAEEPALTVDQPQSPVLADTEQQVEPDETLIRSTPKMLEQGLRPFQRAWQLQNQIADESLQQIRSVLDEENIVSALGKGFMGSLQFLWSPIDAAAKAFVGEPIEDSMKQFGVPDPVAEFVGETAQLGAAVAGPSIAINSLRALRRAPAVSEAIQETRNLVAAKSKVVKVPDRFTTKVTPDEIADADILNPAGNIRTDKFNTTDDIKKVLSVASQKYADEFGEATRGVVSQRTTQQLADDMGMTVEQLMRVQRGQALNAHEALAARQLLASSAAEVSRTAKLARDGGDEAVAVFEQAWLRHAAVQETVAGITAEAGRALNQFKIPIGNVKALREMVDGAAGRFGRDMRQLADEVASLETLGQVSRSARDLTKARFGDKGIELYINWLLSGPQTHAVNVTSNALVSAWTLPEHLIASGLGIARGAKKDRIFAREVLARMRGWVEGSKEGLQTAKKAFRTETLSDQMLKMDVARRQAIGGKFGKIIRIPTRALQAEDEFFKAIGYRMELHALATRSGLSKGLQGDDLARHIQNFINNPSTTVLEQAIHNARYQTFTKPLGEAGNSVLKFANSHPAFRLIMPFIRTPLNIVKFAGERTPLGIFSSNVQKILKEGGPRADLQKARMIFGTGVGSAVAMLAMEGHITGGGPSNPAQRRAMFASGWQPYSIRLGDTHYAFSRFEPLGILFGVSADMADISAHATPEEMDQIGMMIAGSLTKNLINKTYLQGLSDLMQVVNDPERYGQQWLARFAGAVVPTGVAQVARVADPTMRSNMPEEIDDSLLANAQSLINKIKSRIPGMAADLPPVRNMWGEPIKLSPGVAGVIPIYMSVDRKDKASDEIVRLKWRPPIPKKTIRGAKLKASEYDRYSELYGKQAKQLIDPLVNAKGWDKVPAWKKKELLESRFRRAGDIARKRLFGEIPEIQVRAKKSEMKERLSEER
jgi:hypothetical protein